MKDPSLAGHSARRWCATRRSAGPAVRGLSAYDDPATPDVLIKAYPSLGPIRAARRLEHAGCPQGIGPRLLAAVEAGKLPRGDLTADLVRQLRNLKDPELDRSRSAGSGERSARRPATAPG